MSYPTIFLEQKSHQKELRLLLRFDYNTELISITKKLNDSKWSLTMQCWHLHFSQENIALITATFKDITNINFDKLPKKELFKRNLNPAEKTLLNNFYLFLKGKRYSKSTIQTYTFFVADFVNFYTK
ncbi:MAG: hypothetical protein ACJA2M_002011, partial [Polaribacter sp.]